MQHTKIYSYYMLLLKSVLLLTCHATCLLYTHVYVEVAAALKGVVLKVYGQLKMEEK